MIRVVVAFLLGFVAATAATAGGGGDAGATVACSAHSFQVRFEPTREVRVTSRGTLLGSASFAERRLSRTCARVAEPRTYVRAGFGNEIRWPIVLRCATAEPIRVHVNAIRNDRGQIIGSNLVVGTGDPMHIVVSAILKNEGDRYASRIYSAVKGCRVVT